MPYAIGKPTSAILSPGKIAMGPGSGVAVANRNLSHAVSEWKTD